MQWASQLTEGLANLSIKTVLIAVGAILLALSLSRLSSQGKDRTAGWFVDNLQVILSVVVVVFLIIRPFLFQAFYIPSSSMEPTLMGPPDQPGVIHPRETTGDRLLVNKLIYRLLNPHRRDIAVFYAPQNASPYDPKVSRGKDFIKRVIGTPGDTVEVVPPRLMTDGKVLLRLTNDSPQPGISLPEKSRPEIQEEGRRATMPLGFGGSTLKVIADPHAELSYDPFRVTVDGRSELDDPNGRITAVEGFASYGGDGTLLGTLYTIDAEPRLAVVRTERLGYEAGHVVVNGETQIEHYIKEAPKYAMAPRKLGPNEYFMMGDNRNNSNDSHVWGPLTRDRMIGRAELLFWPLRRAHAFQWWLVIFLGALFFGYQLMLRAMTPQRV